MAPQEGVGKTDAFIPITNFGQQSVRDHAAIFKAVLEAVTKCHAPAVGVSCVLGGYDGVFTLVEDHGPLVSYIAEKLGLNGSPLAASTVFDLYSQDAPHSPVAECDRFMNLDSMPVPLALF